MTLTARQIAAIEALLSRPTLADAAHAAGVTPRSINRWLHDDAEFRAAVQQAEAAALDALARRLAALSDGALNTLAVVMYDPTQAAGVRVRAASILLDAMLRVREARDIEQRLATIEQIIGGSK